MTALDPRLDEIQARYLVAILGDLEHGDGYEPLGVFQVSAPHEDAAIDAAFNEARSKFPEVGDMNLSWVKPAEGQIVAGGDIRFIGGAK